MDSSLALREEEQFRARSYNRAKQVLTLVDHLFVRYRIPMFLYRSILSPEGIDLVFGATVGTPRSTSVRVTSDEAYRAWFFAVARGESFAKATRDVFTKREAHLFLLAPSYHTVEQNIFWARAAAAGLPPAACDFLVQKFDDELRVAMGDRLPDLLRFFAGAWTQLEGFGRDELTDFICAMVRDRTFSFKNRTFGSMRKRCIEWHRTVHGGRVGRYHFWLPQFREWESKNDRHLIRAEELTNNRALAEEGKTQRHCVLLYAHTCAAGRRSIVSLRWFAKSPRPDEPNELRNRLTIEIDIANRTVVQIRGKMNRRAVKEEMPTVRQWAGDLGLRISEHA
jgi:hypothetical protein